MNVMNELRAFLLDRLDQGSTQTEIAGAAAIQQSSLSRFLKNGEGLSAENFLKLLDWAGWSVEQSRAVRPARCGETGLAVGNGCPPPDAEYLAVPLVQEAKAGPGPLPPNGPEAWFPVRLPQPAPRCGRDLIAVEMGARSTSMLPTLRPGDIVLVDRGDRDVSRPGRLMLVLDPGGTGKIRRVCIEELRRDVRITYYSDNLADHAPEVYSLKEDFAGNREKSIVGRVVRAWTDIREA